MFFYLTFDPTIHMSCYLPFRKAAVRSPMGILPLSRWCNVAVLSPQSRLPAPVQVHVQLVEGNLNARLIQRQLAVLRDAPLSRPEILLPEPTAHAQVDAGTAQPVHEHQPVPVLQHRLVLFQHVQQNFLRQL